MSENDLQSLAKFTNGAYILHYSGNCVLLATCLYYNLLQGKKLISVKNISSPLIGLESIIVEEMIFGSSLDTLADRLSSIQMVTSKIQEEHAKTGRLYYNILAEGYMLPILGESGHAFNAAIVNDNKVLYVDAWKTSNYITSSEMMYSRFSKGASFEIRIMSIAAIRDNRWTRS